MSPLEQDDLGRLRDIQAYGQRAIRHLAGATFQAFVADEKTYDGVVRCLAVVGEAAWKLSKSFQEAHPATPWALLAAMRHRLVHEYGGVDDQIVYRVITSDLPTLLTTVDSILTAQSQP